MGSVLWKINFAECLIQQVNWCELYKIKNLHATPVPWFYTQWSHVPPSSRSILRSHIQCLQKWKLNFTIELIVQCHVFWISEVGHLHLQQNHLDLMKWTWHKYGNVRYLYLYVSVFLGVWSVIYASLRERDRIFFKKSLHFMNITRQRFKYRLTMYIVLFVRCLNAAPVLILCNLGSMWVW